MIPTVSAYKHILPLATLVLASISVFAQAPPKYDATTEIKVEGTVGEVRLVPPTGGKPVAYLVTRPDKDKNTVQILWTGFDLIPNNLFNKTPFYPGPTPSP